MSDTVTSQNIYLSSWITLYKDPDNFETRTVLLTKPYSIEQKKNKLVFVRFKKSNEIQKYADIYLLLNYSTRFGRPSRPSSGAHNTVVAASGTSHTIWGASFLKRDQIRAGLEAVSF